MGYQVLARKYRPQRFADVAGQDHVTRTLLNALSQNRIAHGYIFSGHRGIGKTTIARILAMALNCSTEIGTPERPTPEPCLACANCREISAATRSEVNPFEESHSFDVEEIDAATNRGIDEARTLTAKIQGRPLKSKYRIIILDEAHQITDAAWNSLLKTLEEPPDWAVFMFATTQPEDIPQTIRSRCQHFSFHAVKFEDILAQLKMIAGREQVDAEDAALALLAEAGDGSMRDALSIMDQAIASAPSVDGKCVLSAAQIRELMGSVPNAVFEKLLEAVAAGQSAELMEQLNVLLNAGHSPSSLARQMVRYLRNTLMAKLGGEQTELLQISGDERGRVARTALLFSEEEITRNLQIVLRTFDDLNYRQEQRFHLELGLLKLVHAQRLLPLEELLSGVTGGGGRNASPAPARTPTATRTPPRATSAGAPSAPVRPASSAGPAPAGSKPTPPSISPFGESDGGWGTGPSVKQSSASAPVAEMERPSTVTAAAAEVERPSVAPLPEAKAVIAAEAIQVATVTSPFAPLSSEPVAGYAEVVTEGALAKAPVVDRADGTALNSDTLRQSVVSALANAGHASASQVLGTGVWALDVSSLRIEVAGMGKKMLSLTVNTAAEKIIRQELQRVGGPARFMVVPGDGPVSTTTTMAAPLAGSVQEAAMANPLVQRAKEIFNAEVRSVVDLRTK
jgi:DNA polymerase-3 subunit gamma/tau